MDLREAYAKLDPVAPLESGSPLYVERPVDVVGRLASELLMDASPRHILLAGQRGAGKSTELARLAQAVAHQLEPIHLSIQDYIKDIYSEFTPDDIIDALSRAATDRLAVWQRVPEYLKGQRVPEYLRTSGATSPAGRRAAVGIVTAIDGIESVAGRRPCFFVDDFDRVPYENAERVLLRALPLLGQIPCNLVIVVHVSVVHSSLAQHARELMSRVATLPNLVVHRGDGTIANDGLEVMLEVLRRRIQRQTNLVEPEAAHLVATLSAGVVGEMMWLMQTACASAVYQKRDKVGVGHVQEAAAERRRTYMRDLDSSDLEALRDVMKTGKVRDSERRRRLLYTGALLEYENSHVWWGCHPVLWPLFNG